jgi:hypothetical protein
MIHHLHQRYEQLEVKAKRCQTLVQVEAGKVRAEDEKKNCTAKGGDGTICE